MWVEGIVNCYRLLLVIDTSDQSIIVMEPSLKTSLGESQRWHLFLGCFVGTHRKCHHAIFVPRELVRRNNFSEIKLEVLII